jgi:hypothetical protein
MWGWRRKQTCLENVNKLERDMVGTASKVGKVGKGTAGKVGKASKVGKAVPKLPDLQLKYPSDSDEDSQEDESEGGTDNAHLIQIQAQGG